MKERAARCPEITPLDESEVKQNSYVGENRRQDVDRCHGKTKSGTRCKRSVREGSRFCATHAGQPQGLGDANSPGETSQEREPLETLIVLAAAGAVLFAVLTVRRFFRFL
jgi:hypothetical protein